MALVELSNKGNQSTVQTHYGGGRQAMISTHFQIQVDSNSYLVYENLHHFSSQKNLIIGSKININRQKHLLYVV
jgi:hypothetical protein